MSIDKVPEDLHSLMPWFSLIRTARNTGKSGGYSVMRLTVVVDEFANPILFVQPEVQKLMPRMTARDALEEVLQALVS
jgi:hypothetical protein